ncbi:hypothetical protein [Burkholderia sp. BE17]|uniref:hypothetical protein n=1 Tax=Burkholderia sp. BE17 TaxID=2656644 RepID=UPI00128C2CA2|nr:hypothetical protein [Burkholderia sp. BE17]MPV68013.1 hypothetical protein [Burkholderia sp. BE17]
MRDRQHAIPICLITVALEKGLRLLTSFPPALCALWEAAAIVADHNTTRYALNRKQIDKQVAAGIERGWPQKVIDGYREKTEELEQNRSRKEKARLHSKLERKLPPREHVPGSKI